MVTCLQKCFKKKIGTRLLVLVLEFLTILGVNIIKELKGLNDEVVIVKMINFDTVGIIGLKKSKSTHWKSKRCKRSFLSTPNSKDE